MTPPLASPRQNVEVLHVEVDFDVGQQSGAQDALEFLCVPFPINPYAVRFWIDQPYPQFMILVVAFAIAMPPRSEGSPTFSTQAARAPVRALPPATVVPLRCLRWLTLSARCKVLCRVFCARRTRMPWRSSWIRASPVPKPCSRRSRKPAPPGAKYPLLSRRSAPPMKRSSGFCYMPTPRRPYRSRSKSRTPLLKG